MNPTPNQTTKTRPHWVQVSAQKQLKIGFQIIFYFDLPKKLLELKIGPWLRLTLEHVTLLSHCWWAHTQHTHFFTYTHSHTLSLLQMHSQNSSFLSLPFLILSFPNMFLQFSSSLKYNINSFFENMSVSSFPIVYLSLVSFSLSVFSICCFIKIAAKCERD